METHDRPGFPWWLALLLMFALATVVGGFTYNLGLAQGAAQVAPTVAAPGAAAPPVVYYYPRHWHVGFGVFPFFGLFWVFIFFAFLRRLWWGPRWYRRGCGYYGRYGYYDRPDLDEWHRRAHNPQPPPPTTTQL